jgi:transcription elongation factor Elf1
MPSEGHGMDCNCGCCDVEAEPEAKTHTKCVCPSCGNEKVSDAEMVCATMKCPACGAAMAAAK